MNLKFGQSAREMMPWLPVIARRCAHYFGFAVALLVFAGALALLEGFAGPWIACGIALTAVGLYFRFRTTRRIQKRYFLRLEAETFASIPWALAGETRQDDSPQIARAKANATEAFPDNEDLVLISKLVPSILFRTTHALLKVEKIMPFQPAAQWRHSNRAVMRRGLGYIADALTVNILRHSRGNPFEEARRGVIAYGTQWRTMLRAGMRLAFRGWAFAAVAVIVAGLFALASFRLFGIESISARIWALGTAGYVGCALKWSLFDPVAALVSARLLSPADEQPLDGSGWEARVEIASHEYVILKKAADERAERVQSFEPATVAPPEAEDVG